MEINFQSFFSSVNLTHLLLKQKTIAAITVIACGILFIGIIKAIYTIYRTYTYKTSQDMTKQDKKVSDARGAALPSTNKLKMDPASLERILTTTLESLKNELAARDVKNFESIRIDLHINKSSHICTVSESGRPVPTSELLELESVARLSFEQIARSASTFDANGTLDIKWDFIITNEKGIHTFFFVLKQTPRGLMANGALFGSPGYRFQQAKPPLSKAELNQLEF